VLSYFLGFTGFLVTLMLQLSVFSQWKILSGSADIVLLYVIAWSLYDRTKWMWIMLLIMLGMVSLVSALPFFIPAIVYLLVFWASRLVQSRVWQTPLLAMFVLTFGATLVQILLTVGFLFVQRADINFSQALIEVALPALLLNMLLAIPIHALVRELAFFAFPQGVEE